MTCEPIARSVQTMHLSCVESNTIYKWTETSLPLTHVPKTTIEYVQNDFHAVVHSAQTVHLSCVEINTISKWTEMSFHFTHVT